jgi:hypothetical protein
MSRDRDHRTSSRTLSKLAQGHMFFEFGSAYPGRWDTFSTRTLGLAVNRKMATEFGGHAGEMLRATADRLAHMLGISLSQLKFQERWAFDNFAVALSLARDLKRWTPDEKRSLLAIIRAKAGPSETRYLQLMQQHARLRDLLLREGSQRQDERSS